MAAEVDKALTISSWLLVFGTTTCHRHRENAVHYIPRESGEAAVERRERAVWKGADKLARRC